MLCFIKISQNSFSCIIWESAGFVDDMWLEAVHESSDVDAFVDTETPNPFLLMDAKEFLERLVGRSVDIIRNHKNLNPRLRSRIERDGVAVFWG